VDTKGLQEIGNPFYWRTKEETLYTPYGIRHLGYLRHLGHIMDPNDIRTALYRSCNSRSSTPTSIFSLLDPCDSPNKALPTCAHEPRETMETRVVTEFIQMSQ